MDRAPTVNISLYEKKKKTQLRVKMIKRMQPRDTFKLCHMLYKNLRYNHTKPMINVYKYTFFRVVKNYKSHPRYESLPLFQDGFIDISHTCLVLTPVT